MYAKQRGSAYYVQLEDDILVLFKYYNSLTTPVFNKYYHVNLFFAYYIPLYMYQIKGI